MPWVYTASRFPARVDPDSTSLWSSPPSPLRVTLHLDARQRRSWARATLFFADAADAKWDRPHYLREGIVRARDRAAAGSTARGNILYIEATH